MRHVILTQVGLPALLGTPPLENLEPLNILQYLERSGFYETVSPCLHWLYKLRKNKNAVIPSEARNPSFFDFLEFKNQEGFLASLGMTA